MIVVLGLWPRSGTSLLMSMLTAGGLDPIRNDSPGPAAGFPVGAFQHTGVFADVSVLRALPGRGGCVKLFTRHVLDLPGAGIVPTGVVVAHRPYVESVASWESVWPDRCALASEEWHTEVAEKAMAVLDGVPVLHVEYHDLVDDPDAQSARIAGFVAGGLDVAAMARVPIRMHRHFGGPPNR